MLLFLRSKNRFCYIPENESEQDILGRNNSYREYTSWCIISIISGCVALYSVFLFIYVSWIAYNNPNSLQARCVIRADITLIGSVIPNSLPHQSIIPISSLIYCWNDLLLRGDLDGKAPWYYKLPRSQGREKSFHTKY